MSITNADRKRTTITDQARTFASALVDREEYRVRSRMLAYENIGSMIGASGAWVRKFVNGYAEATPKLTVGMNIIALYEQWCGRIEQDTKLKQIRTRMLNAAVQSIDELDSCLDSRAESGTELQPETAEGLIDVGRTGG